MPKPIRGRAYAPPNLHRTARAVFSCGRSFKVSVPKLALFCKPFFGGPQGLSRLSFASIFCIAQALEKAGARDGFRPFAEVQHAGS
jgi:hypothetical protein